jgi:hypothetical protein
VLICRAGLDQGTRCPNKEQRAKEANLHLDAREDWWLITLSIVFALVLLLQKSCKAALDFKKYGYFQAWRRGLWKNYTT